MLITNVLVFDGTGSDLYPGEVLIDRNRIVTVARGHDQIDRTGHEIVDGGGATLMPGMVESHTHLAFCSTVDHETRLHKDLSLDERLLRTVHTAETLLDYGFTSVYSGGTTIPGGEVLLRDAIKSGWLRGPRIRACSLSKRPDGKSFYPGIEGRSPDPEGMAKFVGEMAALGVDQIKLILTGESGNVPGTSRKPQFFSEEAMAASLAAREHGLDVSAHCHSAESIKLAMRAKFRVLYHCTWADEEAIDMLEAGKDDIFVTPGPGINWANIHEGASHGITREVAEHQEQFVTLERVIEVMPELHKRGVRVLPGGDYGFPWNPIGKNARDLKIFVDLFGFTPAAALTAVTKQGGELMDIEVGLMKGGYLADLLLVDGNPLNDVAILQDRDRLVMIMKDGIVHKSALHAQEARVAA